MRAYKIVWSYVDHSRRIGGWRAYSDIACGDTVIEAEDQIDARLLFREKFPGRFRGCNGYYRIDKITRVKDRT